MVATPCSSIELARTNFIYLRRNKGQCSLFQRHKGH